MRPAHRRQPWERASGTPGVGVVLLAVVGLAALATTPVGAAPEESSEVHPPVDRTLSRGIRRAKASIAAGEYSQAVRFLDEVLAREDDYFVENRDRGEFVGLKEAARQLIRNLPPAGQAVYEAIYGPIARRLLDEAVAAGDVAAYEMLVQRYFDTPAGYEAALLLAREELDAGRRLSAASLYDELLKAPKARARFDPGLSIQAAGSWLAAGDPRRAEAILASAPRSRRQQAPIAGKPRTLSSDGASLPWLASVLGTPAEAPLRLERQWVTFRGNPARNGEVRGGLPHMRVRWRVRLLGPPRLETTFEDVAADLVQSGNVVPVAAAPLAVGDYVLVQTPQSLLAVDFRTGKRVWRTEPQPEAQLNQLIAPQLGSEGFMDPEPARAFARRIWEDYLHGSVSSDGQRAYVIRGLALPAQAAWDAWQAPFMGRAEDANAANRLCAYDLSTQGKLSWEIDGAAADGEFSGAFFLGAPVAVGPSLFVLAEVKNRVYLAAIDAASGKVRWKQQLVDLEVQVTMNIRRRLQAAMPSYDSGMLVCPTGAGMVVAVDANKRSLAWAYRYSADPPPQLNYGSAVPPRAPSNRWLDPAVVIADDRVLITPPEGDELHCLDLLTGQVRWKIPRGSMLRLACVDRQTILLVGNHDFSAVRLEDGKPAWSQAESPLAPGEAPTGAGFLSAGKYYLPLSTGEIIAIDVAAGQIVARTRSRDGAPLGNLICHRGAVISNTGMYLDRFDQVLALERRAERRIAADPDDQESLRTMGEIAFNDGRLSEAVDLLEHAYRAGPSELSTRTVLGECLIAALSQDFAAFRRHLPLLKELDDSHGLQLPILRIEAQGLLSVGEPLASADACFELFDRSRRDQEVFAIDRNWDTTVVRWVHAQLLAIWDQADDADRAELQRRILARVPAGDERPRGEQLRRLVEFFGDLPMMEPLKLARAVELLQQKQDNEAQQLLLDLVESHTAEIRREAVARLAVQLHDSGWHAAAAEFDRELAGPLANVPCLDGATGRELSLHWSKEAELAPANWPRGKVETSILGPTPTESNRARMPLQPVRWEHCDSILGQASALFAPPGSEFFLADSLGKEIFHSRLEKEFFHVRRGNANVIHFHQPGSMYAASRGSFVVVSLGRQIAGMATLPGKPGASPPVLWGANLGGNFDFVRSFRDQPIRSEANRPGSFRAARAVLDGRWIGVIGPVTSRGCVFQDQRRLTCVDLFTGAVAWSHGDVPAGCDLYGDARYIVAAPPNGRSAKLFGTVDGRYLGEVKVPPWREQLATLGRKVLRWRSLSSGRFELACLDPAANRVDWRRSFDPNSRVDVERSRFVAVVSPAGRATIIDALDGATLVETPISPLARLDEIHLAVGSDHFLLLASQPGTGDGQRFVKPLNVMDAPVIDGQLYVFDRSTGQLRWSRGADVTQQAYLLTQPVDLPFVVFAGTVTSTDHSGTRTGTTMLVLDKATGRTLFHSDDLPQAGVGHCTVRVADAEQHTARIEMSARTVALRYTDKRRPPEPPAMADVESVTGKSSGGLWGVFRNLGRGP